MRSLMPGMKGPLISRFQTFLTGQGYSVAATGEFDAATVAAAKRYQRAHGLVADGAVGNLTLQQAMRDGFALIVEQADSKSTKSQFFPPRPSGIAPLSDGARNRIFGDIPFKADGTRSNPERVVIPSKWTAANIVRVKTPELAAAKVGIGKPRGKGGKPVAGVSVNRAIASQFSGLLQAWRDAGLLDGLLTWNGTFVPRFIRGSTTRLSNHSWGTAFDVNVAWNKLNTVPALAGNEGSVRELVTLANQFGFYWGGHYQNRLDGMHFECVKIV